MDLGHERKNTRRVWRGHINNGSKPSCYGVDLRLHSTCVNRQKMKVCGGETDSGLTRG